MHMSHLYQDAASIDGVSVTSPKRFRRTNRILAAKDLNPHVPNALVGQCTFEGFSEADMHTHDCVELVYILEGKGESVIGDERVDLLPHRLIVFPKQVLHNIKNLQEEQMKVLFIFPEALTSQELYARAVNAAKAAEENSA